MKIIIIGAEAAGASAAAKVKRMLPDAVVRVYEKTQVVSFGACGLPYFIGDNFSDANEMISRTPEQFAQTGIEMRVMHEVEQIDPIKKTITVKDLVNEKVFEDRYDKLVLAVGASPIIPPLTQLDLANIFTLRTLHDGVAFKALLNDKTINKVAIVGAGYIGLELAEALVEQGKQPLIVQLNERVLIDVFDKEITDVVEAELRRHSELYLNETVQGFKGDKRVETLCTDKGEYPVDAVIIATGVRPNSILYRDIGLKLLGNGAIVVDAYGQTSLPDIFAAGDCAAVKNRITETPFYMPLATTANKMGRIVGENLAGKKSAFPGSLGTAALRVFALEVSRTGLTEMAATQAGIPYKTVFIQDKNHSNYLAGQTAIYAKVLYHAQTRALLGGQLVGGSGAALRANVLACAIWTGATVDELAMMDFLYAPPFSRPWDVLNVLGSVAK